MYTLSKKTKEKSAHRIIHLRKTLQLVISSGICQNERTRIESRIRRRKRRVGFDNLKCLRNIEGVSLSTGTKLFRYLYNIYIYIIILLIILS